MEERSTKIGGLQGELTRYVQRMPRSGKRPLMMLVRIWSSFQRSTNAIPARRALIIFTALIFVWTSLLALPISSATGEPTPVVDAFFTAISAICVTGLTTVDMATHWSLFGDVLIVLGMQVGAVGVLSLAAIMGLTVTRRLGLRQRLMAVSDSNPMRTSKQSGSDSDAVRLGDMRGLLGAIVVSTLLIEAVLVLLLWPELMGEGYAPIAALGYAVYFASAAFTNTGFVPVKSGMEAFVGDPYMLIVLMLGVFIGSLGFPVIFALWRYVTGGGWRAHKRLGLHAKLTLATTLVLLIGGAIAIGGLEYANDPTFGKQGFWQTLMNAMFMSTMTRSGGFAVVDVNDMGPATHLVMDMLMFVGGGSASTAGGIKVTTLAVLFLAAWAEARGYRDLQIFGRRIPTEVLRVAVAVVIWGTTIVLVSTITIASISGESLDRVLFEVISGFASCGLSNNLSAELPSAGKIVLAITIWAGRVGTVTLASAVAATSRARLYRYPEERPIVG